jgi:phosphoribosylaminoimidazolecarboxamide formyltransferase/IMP cyclohydrolase
MRGTDITDFKRTYRTRNEGVFPDRLVIDLQKEWDLKYGENPSQHGAIYSLNSVNGHNASIIAELTDLQSVRSDGKGKGGLSATNTADITRGMDCLKYFTKTPAIVMMKHNTVSGFAKQSSPDQKQVDLFRLCREVDRRSNFGCVMASNRPINMETATAMFEIPHFFVDVLAAPEYDDGVIGYIQSKKNDIRIAQFSQLNRLPKFYGDDTYGMLSIKEMPTGRINVQDLFLTSIKGPEDLIFDPMVIDRDGVKHIVKRDPPHNKLGDLLTTWLLNCSSVRSNGVVCVKDGVTVAVGSGQVERVGAVENMIIKGMQKAMDRAGIKYDPLMGIQGWSQLGENPFQGAVVSSDGFFPFGDSIDLLARMGIAAIIQPFGSNRDAEVIDAANKHNIAMAATCERCFLH